MNVNLSYSKNLAHDYVSYSCNLEELSKIVSSDINYSPFQYDNGHRKEINSHLELCNTIMLDFDDGVIIEDIKSYFDNNTYLIATTKSHQKEKNGKVCDRFRLILPLDKNIDLTIDEYKMMMQLLIVRHGADASCKDISRFFYGYLESETFINYGKLTDWGVYYRQAMMLNNLKMQQKENVKKPPTKLTYQGNNDCNTKVEWFEKFSATQQMLNYFEFDTRFIEGGRNAFLYGVAKHLQENGCDSNFIRSEVLWINSQGKGNAMEENEIERTIFRSCGV